MGGKKAERVEGGRGNCGLSSLGRMGKLPESVAHGPPSLGESRLLRSVHSPAPSSPAQPSHLSEPLAAGGGQSQLSGAALCGPGRS